MEINLNQMSQTELVNYIREFDNMSLQNISTDSFNWSVMDLSVDELIVKINSNSDKQYWKEWIDEEQKERISEWGYDSVGEISNYWLSDPHQEPIIIAETKEGTIEIWDGFHRFGIAVKNNFKNIPVILGTF
ncbi:ParB N-terminal domain-containing protein [Priestia megaterium]